VTTHLIMLCQAFLTCYVVVMLEPKHVWPHASPMHSPNAGGHECVRRRVRRITGDTTSCTNWRKGEHKAGPLVCMRGPWAGGGEDEFALGELIGKGSYGCVYHCTRRDRQDRSCGLVAKLFDDKRDAIEVSRVSHKRLTHLLSRVAWNVFCDVLEDVQTFRRREPFSKLEGVPRRSSVV
jgi:hypothetical protein